VTCYSSDPCGSYNPFANTVTWGPWNLDGDDTNTITLTVQVTQEAVPGSTITNLVEMHGDSFYATDTEDTIVCCWTPSVLYVDDDAAAGGNGFSWSTAFNNLQDALDFAESHDCYTAIWVEAGTYKPTNDANETNASFILPDNIALIGHFAGGESSPLERNLADANNETILDGQIGQNPSDAVYNVVKAVGDSNAFIDGFTIKGGYLSSEGGTGLYVQDSNIAVVNCLFEHNRPGGICVKGTSFADVFNCTFLQNWTSGIYTYDEWPAQFSVKVTNCIFDGNNVSDDGLNFPSASTIDVQGCTFRNHSDAGISVAYADVTITRCRIESNNIGLSCSNSDTIINRSIICDSAYEGLHFSSSGSNSVINNWIYRNGLAHYLYGSSGVYFNYSSADTLIRNNTIYDNWPYGIMAEESSDPNITNCIIWGNDTNDLYRDNGPFSHVNYCLLQHVRAGNITGDPCFYNSAVNDLHLTGNSPCVDYNGTGTYPNEIDFDGEDRTINGKTDIGGDEYYWPKADYDKNWIVNFLDYSRFAEKWLTTDPCISLDAYSDVDIYDLGLFCVDWLWQAPWGDNFSFLGMGGDGFGGETFASESLFTSDEGPATGDELMIPDVVASLEAMPDSLYARVEKFYTVASAQPVYLSPQQRAAIIADMLTWLDETWLTGGLYEQITYDQYIAFRASLLLFTQQDY